MTQPAGPDDATLAVAAASGDRAAFAAIYDRYSTRLLGFCISMLRSRADAEDCLQDVFVIAATKLRDLREPAMLRSWLFAVARHECLGRIDRRRKEVPVDEVPDRADVDVDVPSSMALDTELADLLRDAQAGLSDRDRLLLELADRQQLSGEEFAKAIGVPRSTAYTLLARARATARTSIGALLVARTGRRQCATLDGLLAGWDGELTTLRRKQIARHIDNCEVCAAQERRVASPAALLGDGQAYGLDLVALRMRVLAAAAAAMPGVAWRDGWPPADRLLGGSKRRRRAGVLGAVAASLLVIAAIGVSSHGSGPTTAGAGSAVSTIATSPGGPSAGGASPSTSRSPTPTPTPSPTSVSASTVTVTHVVVVAPPSTSAAHSGAGSTASSPIVTWTLTVDTPASVRVAGVLQPACSSNQCAYTVPDGSEVEVIANDTDETLFSSPTDCRTGHSPNDCALTMTANDTVGPPIIQ
jgi:RNA polymerase sigma factor (sigma-70 family)